MKSNAPLRKLRVTKQSHWVQIYALCLKKTKVVENVWTQHSCIDSSTTLQDVLCFCLAAVLHILQLAYPSQSNERAGTVGLGASRVDLLVPACHGYFGVCGTAVDKCLLHLSQAQLSPSTSGRILWQVLRSASENSNTHNAVSAVWDDFRAKAIVKTTAHDRQVVSSRTTKK